MPEQLISRDFAQHRISSQVDAAVIHTYEEILHEWIQSIEAVLSEGGSDDRYLLFLIWFLDNILVVYINMLKFIALRVNDKSENNCNNVLENHLY